MSTSAEVRRLTKSRTDRMIDGVCGGIAAYFNLDPTLVRIAWVLLILLGGSGILLYIAAMILMPKDPSTPVQTPGAPPDKASRSNTTFWGILLVVVGLFWLAGNLGLHVWHHMWGLSMGVLIPVLLILAGVAFLFGGRNSMTVGAAQETAHPGEEPSAAASGPSGTAGSRLVRSRADKKIAGVCGGIGAYTGLDPVIVRLLFVLAGLGSIGLMIILYIVLAIVLPLEPEQAPSAAVAGA